MEEKKNEKMDKSSIMDKMFIAAIIITVLLLVSFGVLAFIFLSHLTNQ